MLEVRSHADIDDKPIFKAVSLAVYAGEVHAIVRPKGAGGSTLDGAARRR